MADVLIRGMEMPATCFNCKLKVGFSACGLVTDYKDGGFFYRVYEGNSRPDWCPLVPIPEPPEKKANETPSKPERGRQRKSGKANKSQKPFADYSWGDCQGEEGGPRRGSCEMGEA